jgi:hypothetical protein
MQQFHGRRKSAFRARERVPEGVRAAARLAFELRDVHGFRGATETGWKRAEQLAQERTVPLEDLRFIRNWYARHVHTSYPGYAKWVEEGMPRTGEGKLRRERAVMAWLTWGGDAGKRWVDQPRVAKVLGAAFGPRTSG